MVGALVIALSLLGGWLEIVDAAPQACLDADRVEQRVGAAGAGALRARASGPRGRGPRGRAPHGPRPADRRARRRGRHPRDHRAGLGLPAAGRRRGPAPDARPGGIDQGRGGPGCASCDCVRADHDRLGAGRPGARACLTSAEIGLVRSWLGAGTVAGAPPGVGLGPALGLRGRWQRWSLGGEARFDWAFPTDHDGFRIRSWRPTLGVDACLHPRVLGLCTGLRGGLLRASSGRSSTSPSWM